MNKWIVWVTSVGLLACAGTASAQSGSPEVKGWLNFANITISGDGTATVERDARKPWTVGGLGDVPLAKNLFLQRDVFTTNGTEIPVAGVGHRSSKTAYLDVPFVLRLDLRKTGKAIPYVYAGPAFSFLSAANRSDVGLAAGCTHENIGDDCQSTDVGFALGAGIRFGQLSVEARYVQGFRNIAKPTTKNATSKNRAFEIIGGVRF